MTRQDLLLLDIAGRRHRHLLVRCELYASLNTYIVTLHLLLCSVILLQIEVTLVELHLKDGQWQSLVDSVSTADGAIHIMTSVVTIERLLALDNLLTWLLEADIVAGCRHLFVTERLLGRVLIWALSVVIIVQDPLLLLLHHVLSSCWVLFVRPILFMFNRTLFHFRTRFGLNRTIGDDLRICTGHRGLIGDRCGGPGRSIHSVRSLLAHI